MELTPLRQCSRVRLSGHRPNRGCVAALAAPSVGAARRVLKLAVVLVLYGTACIGGQDEGLSSAGTAVIPRSARGPELRLADSLVLEESDTAYVGRIPYTFTVDREGAIFVPDQSSDRLLVFRRDGQLAAVYGRHGRGPGEFTRIKALTIPLDTIIIQGMEGGTVLVLARSDGRELTRLHHSGRLDSWTVGGEALALGINDAGAWQSIALLPHDGWLHDGLRVRPTFGGLPEDYRQYRELRMHAMVHLVGWADTLLVGYTGTNVLVRHLRTGTALDTIEAPTRLRRGVPRSVLPLFRNPSLDFHTAVSVLSDLFGIWRTTAGEVVLWYQDGTTEDAANPKADLQGTAYVTVLAPDLRSACVDGRIDAPGSGRPRLAFSNDTLYSLDQVLEGPELGRGRVRTVVRRYVVDTGNCEWYPTSVRAGG